MINNNSKFKKCGTILKGITFLLSTYGRQNSNMAPQIPVPWSMHSVKFPSLNVGGPCEYGERLCL